MSKSLLDSTAGGAFMAKTVSEANIERTPTTSSNKVNSIEEL
jgi:hypothetical protein